MVWSTTTTPAQHSHLSRPQLNQAVIDHLNARGRPVLVRPIPRGGYDTLSARPKRGLVGLPFTPLKVQQCSGWSNSYRAVPG